jgi:ABC-type uncharacterized transport system auxiliary subunit
MQKHKYLAAAATAAFLALGACNNEPETLTINEYDPQAAALANAAPVQLPPAITDNRAYRCSDNSLVYVDFYNNNSATIRTSQDGEAVTLTGAGGPPYTAEGYSVSANATNVRITAPGKNNLSCHT